MSYGFEVDRTTTLGLLCSGRNLIDYSTNLADNIVSKTEYRITSLGSGYVSIGDAGKVYFTDLANPTHTVKDTITGKNFDTNSCAFTYKDGLYITSQNDIYYDDFTFTIKQKTWWTVTKGKTALTTGVPHKIFEFNGVMFVLNGNKIASWDGTTATDAAFTLPTGWVITDAQVDNDNIFLTAYLSLNGFGYNRPSRIFVWNGITTITWQREIPVASTDLQSIKKADQGFVLFGGSNMYFFDGYNIQWLRYIPNTPNFNQVIYANGNVLFVAYQGIASYNTRFKIYTHPISWTGAINTLGVGFLDHIDIMSASGNHFYRGVTNTCTSTIFYSNWYDLQNSFVRRVEVCFSTPLATGATYDFRIYDESGNAVYTRTISRAVDGNITKFSINPVGVRAAVAQVRMTWNNSANSNIRYIKLFYEQSENNFSK